MRNQFTKRLCLIISMCLLFSSCKSSGGGNTGTSQNPENNGKPAVSESTAETNPPVKETEPEKEPPEVVTVTAEDMTTDSKTGVRLELSPFMFDYPEDELSVSIQPEGTETADNGDWQITAYDIDIGDMHDLDTFIDIRIPYDGKFCDSGEDPAECVGAKYLNEKTGEWEDVLFDVDKEAGEVVIHTDHLSKYGCIEVKNAGLRNAYISKIDAGELYDSLYGGYIDKSKAALAEYAAKGGPGEECFKLGELAMTDIFTELNSAVSQVNDTGTALQLSDLFFFTEKYAKFNEGFWDKMGDVGFVFGAVNIGIEVAKSDKTPEDILTIYKDTGMWLLGAGADTALGISLVGVSMIDRTITEFAKAAQGYVMERINNVYLYYNDKFPGGKDYGTSHVARTTKEWRDIVANAVAESDGNEKEFKKIIEDEIDTYARKFFKESDNVAVQIQSDFAEHFSGGRVGVITKDQEETLVKQYKERMYQRLSGAILKEMQNDYQRKVEQRLLEKMNEVKEELNRTIYFDIHEDLEDKSEPTLGGYQLRFAELSSAARPAGWSGKLKEDGTAETQATVIGYIIAGIPDHLNVYEPDADMDSAEPVMTAGFSFDFPTTEIVIGGTGDFAGKWYIIGKSGNRTDNYILVEKNSEDSYTTTFYADNGDHGNPGMCTVMEKSSKEMLMDAPDNKGPMRWILTDSDHMTMSGINLHTGDKILGTMDWNLVRGQ
ncbi:MAG: hypothetical protein K6A76_07045 [Oribacterium sp.]|nr:hypothetical protein [Oribacterium sp.]